MSEEQIYSSFKFEGYQLNYIAIFLIISPVVEASISAPEDVAGFCANLEKRLPEYRRMNPEDWSYRMQVAALGEGFDIVTDDEYQSLIDKVRELRPQMRKKGELELVYPGLEGTAPHEIYTVGCVEEDGVRLTYEPHPWDHQVAVNLEPYPKFIVETPKVCFELNFDDSYCLSVKSPAYSKRYEIRYLDRREMSRQEYEYVMGLMEQATDKFGLWETSESIAPRIDASQNASLLY